MQHPGHTALVAGGPGVELAVEPEKEAIAQAQQTGADAGRAAPVRGRLEDAGAQRRRERERHEHRQRHGRHDGDGELPVDHARGAAKEGHGHEHGGQRDANAHQRGRDLAHGVARGLLRRQAGVVHHALHVLHHHDGVVHQQANGQYQGEHGQGVDGIARGRQHAKGAQQHHRHGDRRDQRGAQVLQKDEHHQHHQHHGLGQGDDHLPDGGAHEGRGVGADEVVDLVGEEGLELGQLGRHGVGHGHGVGAVGQHDAHAGAGPAVELGLDRQGIRAQLHACYIFDSYHRTIRGGFEYYGFKFRHGLQLGARGDGGVELLIRHGRQGAQLAGRDLRVLRVQRGDQVRGHELVLLHARRIHPDTHGVEGAEHADVAHAVQAADHVHQVGVQVVAHIHGRDLGVAREEAVGHQVVLAALVDEHAAALDGLGQAVHGRLQLVLHLHLGHVDVGAWRKGEGGGRSARRVRRRAHVDHVVYALELLLDDLRHRVFHRLGRCPRVLRRDGDARRRYVGVLLQRQREDRQAAGEHDDDGQHPREDGAVDEELGHVRLPLIEGRRPAAWRCSRPGHFWGASRPRGPGAGRPRPCWSSGPPVGG